MQHASLAQTATTTRVLVVDDSKVIRQAIKKMLNGDFDVVLAEDGENGWSQIVNDTEIKALITDIEMPVLDGYAFICRIRASEDDRIRDLPIITITGAEDDETKARAYACGSTDFITKPLDAIQLKTRVRAYVRYDQTTRILEEKASALEEEAVNDPLTKLRSRRYFMQRGEQDISHATRHGEDMSVLRIDIDDFKKIYKKYGDDVVDEMLIWFAKQLSQTARTDDTVARIAGSAFSVLTPSTTRDDAMQLAERLRVSMAARPFTHGNEEIAVTVSIGLASMRTDRPQNLEQLLEKAEKRTLHARSEGGNRVCVSVLGEQLAEPEEVVLAEAPEQLANTEAEQPPVLVESPSDSEEIEAAPIPWTDIAKTLEPVARNAEIAELISIDKALQLLAKGEGDKLSPYLENLMLRLQPLLTFYRELQRSSAAKVINKKFSSRR